MGFLDHNGKHGPRPVISQEKLKMPSYYCHDCAVVNGFLRSPPKGDSLTDNVYKLDKYIKHTIPSSNSGYKTTVTGVTSETYQNYVVTAVASGHVQMDSHNKINIVWIGSETTGIALQSGRYVGDVSAFKVVYHSDSNKIHGFPIAVTELRSASCVQCGRTIPY
jgi:hypothetical protein